MAGDGATRVHRDHDRLKIAVLRRLVRLAPAFRHAVVAGTPDEEGNSVEVVRALTSRMPVYWLLSGEPRSVDWLVADLDPSVRLHCLRKDSLGAYVAYLTARYVFFTHGLYGSPMPPARKIFVNLWHGDGPKRRKGFATIRCTHVVSGTRQWGLPRARSFDVPARNVLVTGNPRTDQLGRPAQDEQLEQLNIDPLKPLVLWLPTYRTTEYRGRRMGAVRNWSDGSELSGDEQVRALLRCVAAAAEELGVTVAVKPHRLDSDRFSATGLLCLDDEGLRAARTTLYQLLGRSSGLITDYSSVWTDYLVLDRPCGFFCPDLDDYEERRGLNVDDYSELLPGSLLADVDDFVRFLQECLEESPVSRDRRKQSVERIGAQTALGATERLLESLGLTRPG